VLPLGKRGWLSVLTPARAEPSVPWWETPQASALRLPAGGCLHRRLRGGARVFHTRWLIAPETIVRLNFDSKVRRREHSSYSCPAHCPGDAGHTYTGEERADHRRRLHAARRRRRALSKRHGATQDHIASVVQHGVFPKNAGCQAIYPRRSPFAAETARKTKRQLSPLAAPKPVAAGGVAPPLPLTTHIPEQPARSA
jgi:hypothetical protein